MLWGLLILLTFCLPAPLAQGAIEHHELEAAAPRKRKSKRPVFAVLSDIHIGRAQSEQKVQTALESLLDQEPRLDAIFVVGDVTHNGLPKEYEQAKALFDKLPADIDTYFVMGNHDRYNDLAGVDGLTHFEKIMGQPTSQYLIHKGYPFILVNMATKQYPHYTEEEVKFLAISLEKAEKQFPKKPIFVFCHVPPQNTVYGSGANQGWGSPTLKGVLKNYPQALVFSGHSHFPVVDERSIHQKDFTTINVGSTAYAEVEKGFSEGIHPPYNNNATEAVIATIKRNNHVEIKRIDTYRNTTIQKPWLVKAPHQPSSFSYTRANADHISPEFDVDASIEVRNVSDHQCDFSFSQALDNHSVHHYIVDIIAEGETQVYRRYTVSSQYYLNTAQPSSLQWTATGLQGETNYKVRIVAVDSFGNTSQPISSEYFQTPKFVPQLAYSIPEADLLNLTFNELSATDLSELHHPITYQGHEVNTRFDESLNCYVADFKGDPNVFYKLPFVKSNTLQQELQAGFTIEIYYKSNSMQEGHPIGSLNQGGFAIKHSYLGRAQFSLDVAGRTVQVGDFTLAPRKYNHYVYTYDGKEMRAYTNAIPAGTTKVYGEMTTPKDPKSQWLAIGGNATTGNAVISPLDGSIAYVRIYNKSICRDEAYYLYQLMLNRIDLQNMADFNQLLTITIPRRIEEVSDTLRKDKLKSLIEIGWSLMLSQTTTQQQINEFIHEAKMSF